MLRIEACAASRLPSTSASSINPFRMAFSCAVIASSGLRVASVRSSAIRSNWTYASWLLVYPDATCAMASAKSASLHPSIGSPSASFMVEPSIMPCAALLICSPPSSRVQEALVSSSVLRRSAMAPSFLPPPHPRYLAMLPGVIFMSPSAITRSTTPYMPRASSSSLSAFLLIAALRSFSSSRFSRAFPPLLKRPSFAIPNLRASSSSASCRALRIAFMRLLDFFARSLLPAGNFSAPDGGGVPSMVVFIFPISGS